MVENAAIFFIYLTIFSIFISIGAAIADFFEYRAERRRKNRWWRGS